MTRERIEDFREILLPFVKKRLLETNYENLGESDAEEFEKDFNEICDLAIKALEQESCEDCISRQAVLEAFNLSEKTRKYGGDHSGYDTVMLYEIQDVIEDLPSIQPKPNTDVLDKIIAEIEQLTSRYSISKERGGMGQVEWSDRLIKESDVLQIIDKYKAEKE